MNDQDWDTICIRSSAWERAWEDRFTMNDDANWKHCVKSGSMGMMDDDCWTNLIAAYPPA